MSTPSKADAPKSEGPGLAERLIVELREAAPETRAVLAGLLLVLGAWVGPGIQNAVAAEPAVVTEVVEAAQDQGGAYGEAIRTGVRDAAEDGAPDAAVADED